MKRLIALIVLGCASFALAQTPQPTELPGKPFFIKKTWRIGGEGNWDYLTMDPASLRLFIPHGPVVQVIAVDTGEVAGQVSGFRDAHEVALDDGQFGYVSDGPDNDVKVFDRHSFEIVAKVPTGRNPRAIVFEPASRLVFVICPDSTQPSRTPRKNPPARVDPSVQSTVTVIDGSTQKRLADLIFPGRLGFALVDGTGTVFVNVTDRNQTVSFRATAIASQLHALAGAGDANMIVDWSDTAQEVPAIAKPFKSIRLGADCPSPKSLAVDGQNHRLFAACDNMKMLVLDLNTDQILTSLPIGAGTDAVGYDSDRGLIYAANGGGVGSLTIIRQHLTDSYAVIQELPTQARARTLAVNPQSGEVYLVTNVTGLDLTKPGVGGSAHTLPSVQTAPVKGSFQVLVVGN